MGEAIYKCPECKESDSLFITHQVTYTTQIGKHMDVEDYEVGDITWDDDDDALCSGCGWQGKVEQMIAVEEGDKHRQTGDDVQHRPSDDDRESFERESETQG